MHEIGKICASQFTDFGAQKENLGGGVIAQSVGGAHAVAKRMRSYGRVNKVMCGVLFFTTTILYSVVEV